MATAQEEFRKVLEDIIEARKNPHPVFQKVRTGQASRDQLDFCMRWLYCFTRDFPRYLSGIHARCSQMEVRTLLAENIYEEDTGGLSGTAPHPELYLRMIDALGFDREKYERAKMIPEGKALQDWMEKVTTRGSWVEGVAAVCVAMEAQPKYSPSASWGMADRNSLWLEEQYGVDPKGLEFLRVHSKVEPGHGETGYKIVVKFAADDQERTAAVAALNRSLDLLHHFYEGIGRETGL